MICVQRKSRSQKSCLWREHIWLNVWCMNRTVKFRNDCNRLNTASQKRNKDDSGEWEVNNCWVLKRKPREFPRVYGFYRFRVFPHRVAISDINSCAALRQGWVARRGLPCYAFPHAVHANRHPGDQLHDGVHPAKGIGLSAITRITKLGRFFVIWGMSISQV